MSCIRRYLLNNNIKAKKSEINKKNCFKDKHKNEISQLKQIEKGKDFSNTPCEQVIKEKCLFN